MATVIVTPEADADVLDILRYLRIEAGRVTVDKYSDLFQGFFDRLAIFPGIGGARPRLGRDIRIGIISP